MRRLWLSLLLACVACSLVLGCSPKQEEDQDRGIVAGVAQRAKSTVSQAQQVQETQQNMSVEAPGRMRTASLSLTLA